MELELTNLMVIAGLVTPFLTAVLTKLRDPDWFKGIVSMTGAAIAAFLIEAQQVGLDAVQLQSTAETAVSIWAVHLVTYFGVTKDMVNKLAQLPAVVKMSLPFGPNR